VPQPVASSLALRGGPGLSTNNWREDVVQGVVAWPAHRQQPLSHVPGTAASSANGPPGCCPVPTIKQHRERVGANCFPARTLLAGAIQPAGCAPSQALLPPGVEPLFGCPRLRIKGPPSISLAVRVAADQDQNFAFRPGSMPASRPCAGSASWSRGAGAEQRPPLVFSSPTRRQTPGRRIGRCRHSAVPPLLSLTLLTGRSRRLSHGRAG